MTLPEPIGLQSDVMAGLERLLDRAFCGGDQMGGQLVEAGAGQRGFQMHGSVRTLGEEGQVDHRLRGSGKLDLGFLSRFGFG